MDRALVSAHITDRNHIAKVTLHTQPVATLRQTMQVMWPIPTLTPRLADLWEENFFQIIRASVSGKQHL